MAQFLIWLGFCFINAILCYDSESSSELNRIEYTPLYETIIYSDIADIIKDFENTMNSPVDALFNTDDSESDENIDDLLSEYQHYLDKAHKQRRTYLEKSKAKNKVPLLQHDRFSKSKSTQTNKHDDFYPDNINYYNSGPVQYPQPEFKTPLDFLIPINVMKSRFLNNFEPARSKSKEKSVKKSSLDKIISNENMLQLPPAFPSVFHDSIKSSCYCETDTFPCECGCKQCLMPPEPMQRKHSDYDKFVSSPMFKPNNNDNSLRGVNDNTVNIRIKVDVQFPKFQDSLGEMFKNTSNDRIVEHGSISRESNVNFPFPYFNFPIPLEMFGFKKPNEDSAPIHKITIHRKKKSKSNSNGKRHRKKLITFHNIKLEQQNTAQPSLEENFNTSDHPKIDDTFQVNEPNKSSNYTQNAEHGDNNKSMNQTAELSSVNNTKTGDSIYVMVDIKNNDNITEDIHRNENSIETDYTRVAMQFNASTELPLLRKKRDVSNQNDSTNLTKTPETNEFKRNNTNENDSMKKNDKNQLEDTELLYWPSEVQNFTLANTHNNITTLILDTENKKTKLNVSTESIRHDRTKALEQAIFGDVDWDDVGTVAPVFMSFMGKYIRGVLTFCSESICHSMKCADKNCVHRICAPGDRLNNKGHCNGSNNTDSVASMEAILDLPSNVALEIVDILQDKMLGKLFDYTVAAMQATLITKRVQSYLRLAIIFKSIAFTHNSVKQNPEEAYFNPWVTLLPETQIIDFQPSGIVTKETIPAARLVPYGPEIGVISKKATQRNEITEDIDKLMRKIYGTSKSKHSTKVLTNCNKQTQICQFVTCANIKESCMLCSTFMVFPFYDNTECEKINTEYLSLIKIKDTKKEKTRLPHSSFLYKYNKLYD